LQQAAVQVTYTVKCRQTTAKTKHPHALSAHSATNCLICGLENQVAETYLFGNCAYKSIGAAWVLPMKQFWPPPSQFA
jgi:hypothetical protein